MRQCCSYVKVGLALRGVLEDGAGEESFEAADRFASALAFGLLALTGRHHDAENDSERGNVP